MHYEVRDFLKIQTFVFLTRNLWLFLTFFLSVYHFYCNDMQNTLSHSNNKYNYVITWPCEKLVKE